MMKQITTLNPSSRGCWQKATAMIFVMATVAMVAVIGWAFINGTAKEIKSTRHLLARTRAIHLAESGVEEALYFLQHPDEIDTGDSSYWTGTTAAHIDATNDYFDLSIQQDPNDPTRFDITSIGYVLDSKGQLLAKHTVHASAVAGGAATVEYAAVSNVGGIIWPNMTLSGDFHANGAILNFGTIDGNASSSGRFRNLGTVTGAIMENSDQIDLPSLSASDYQTYTYQGQQYTAATIPRGRLRNVTLGPTPDNPAGVYIRRGNLTIKNNVQINGTLLVTGKLKLRGHLAITAQQGLPALVGDNSLIVKRSNTGLEVTGLVYLGGRIRPDIPLIRRRVTIDITGALVTAGGPVGYFPRGSVTIQHRPELARYYERDAQGGAQARIVSWRE